MAESDNSAFLTVLQLLEQAPASDPERDKPTVQRLLKGDGANLITFTFAPGQQLTEHKAAHPIIVQTMTGFVDFHCGEQTVRLFPGTVVHLPSYVPHAVAAPADAPEESIMQLTMLTGERHST